MPQPDRPESSPGVLQGLRHPESSGFCSARSGCDVSTGYLPMSLLYDMEEQEAEELRGQRTTGGEVWKSDGSVQNQTGRRDVTERPGAAEPAAEHGGTDAAGTAAEPDGADAERAAAAQRSGADTDRTAAA
ncbi:MAG: hypothetical protein V8Q27_08255 [Eubacteriales bacterium]